MTDFQPLDQATANYSQRGDSESSRIHRWHLALVAKNDGTHDYPYCWGYIIFRTVYGPGSDEAFTKAVERLNIYAKAWVDHDVDFPRDRKYKEPKDTRLNEELWSRYYSEVIEDPETLADATVEDVGRQFDVWVGQHARGRKPDGKQQTPNGRYTACVMLDQQGIDNILAMPENPNVSTSEDPEQYDRWVKMMTGWDWPEGTGRFWFRGGIKDAMWELWFAVEDEDFFWEEMCWEDEEHEWNLRSLQGPNSRWNREL